MNNYDKKIESSYIAFLDASNSYGWAMSQKLPVNGFEWVEKEELSKFNKTLLKTMMKAMIQDIFLKQMQSIRNIYLILMKIDHFLRER